MNKQTATCAPVQLPVYMPSEAERSDARLYAENVRKFMVRQSMFIDASFLVACVPVCSVSRTLAHSMNLLLAARGCNQQRFIVNGAYFARADQPAR